MMNTDLICQCGSDKAFVDWWYNHKACKQETFVRCQVCGKIGPSADTEDEAMMLWEANGTTADL